MESLRRETTEGQWPKKRKTSPTRRHKRSRSLKNKEVTEPDMEVSNGECHGCNTMTNSFTGLFPFPSGREKNEFESVKMLHDPYGGLEKGWGESERWWGE